MTGDATECGSLLLECDRQITTTQTANQLDEFERIPGDRLRVIVVPHRYPRWIRQHRVTRDVHLVNVLDPRPLTDVLLRVTPRGRAVSDQVSDVENQFVSLLFLPFEVVFRIFGEGHVDSSWRRISTPVVYGAYIAWTVAFATFVWYRYRRLQITR